MTMNSVDNKCIIYDNDSKSETTLINNSEGNVSVAGWWSDDLILFSERDKNTIYDLRNDRSINITFNGKILYLKEEE